MATSTEGLDETARLWNGAVPYRPAIAARPETTAEVQAAVRVAREHGLPLSVRGGGNDWAGRALRDGGLVIDLSRMRGVDIDPQGQVAVVSGGATASEVLAAAAPHGLVTSTGMVGNLGMAGLTLGGGYGPLCGRFGLALDNLLGAEVVLADGRVVVATAESEPELFWALRGGGGNFGVVTSMRIRLHAVPQVLAGLLAFPWPQAQSVMEGLRGLLAAAPDELTVMGGMMSLPGAGAMFLAAPTWSGDLDAGQTIVDEISSLGTPVMAQVAPMPYAALLGLFDAQMVRGRHYVIRTRTVGGYTPEVIDAIAAAGSAVTSPFSTIALHHFHGAGTRVPVDATPFSPRQDHYVVEIVAGWEAGDDAAAHQGWAESVSAALEPIALPGGYVNLLGPDALDQAALAYSDAARLRAVKNQYDPDGVFTATPLPLAA